MAQERSNFSLAWIQGMTEEEAASFKKSVAAESRNKVIMRLAEILELQYKALERKEIKDSTYDDPAWFHKQAFVNGQRMALQATLELLKFTKD